MAYEHKPGTFSLFKNDKKEADNHPDYKGYGKDTSGKEIEVAAWLKEGTKGKFMSCTFKVKQAQQSQPSKGGAFDKMDDDIPF